MGVERLVLLLDELGAVPDSVGQAVDLYLVAVGDVEQQALVLAENLRSDCSEIRLECHCGGGSFKSQIKRADKSAAKIALILGEDEVAAGTVGLKYLREDRPQETVAQSELSQHLVSFYNF
jgi:histidyl-tRNA synthetase